MEKRVKFSIWYYLLIIALIFLFDLFFFSGPQVREISYKTFRDYLNQEKIENVVITRDKIFGLLKEADSLKQAQDHKAKSEDFKPALKHTPWHLNLEKYAKDYENRIKRQFTVIRLEDRNLIEDLQKHGVDYRGKLATDWFTNFLLNWIIPFAVLFMLWGYWFRRMGKGPGVLNIGKNKAKIYEFDPEKRVTFAEVAGIDEAVEEVKEVVNFLKEPRKYTRLGARLPKGILLVGPPGTGKTLLARAVAGEAGVPFFSMSGSDFVEMFVGVGAARVRDLFAEAKAKAPCIIFIDELDAIGKSRAGKVTIGGGYDERENTLNQLLIEMDGFDPQAGIIIMGATNRPEILDPALLRPGRFDRQILVDRPDFKGRVDILKVHTRNLVLADDVDLEKIAAMTPGFVGADLANLCNEAALLASRVGHDKVTMGDFQAAFERVVAGLEKKNRVINPQERKIVAYHESGHAIVGYLTPGAEEVQKVSIVPRGLGALGYTLQTPTEDRFLMSKSELLGKIKGLLGGRAAEQIVFGEISTGASNDLERATKIARSMIVVYGMSKRLPNFSLVQGTAGQFLDQGPELTPHSEKVEQIIDEEVLEIIGQCYNEALELLQKYREKLDRMANRLLEKENIDADDVKEILTADDRR
ncbi:MAG: ATP-dependent zinc metalloprotease FtsH [Calditrichaeota bacterium]|nr:ATP-dependent zinc metalloprotease FtsH [Calditrichota bacterium]